MFIIEQNAVMGLTNRYLSKIADLIFIHFKETKNLPNFLRHKTRVVGNPIRMSIQHSQPNPDSKVCKVLVFGGSLGANQINYAIDKTLQNNPDLNVEIVLQTGSDANATNDERIKKFKYLDQIQENYNWCDLVIARAGASTIAELRIVSKPCFLVPFPAATDNHQWWNAISLKNENNFYVEIHDPKESDEKLVEKITAFLKKGVKKNLDSSHSGPQVVDSGEALLGEIFSYVGVTKKT